MPANLQALLQLLPTKPDLQLLSTKTDLETWAQRLEGTFKSELNGLWQQQLAIETRVTDPHLLCWKPA